MKRRLKVLRAFIFKEIRQVLRDKRMRIVLFIAPIFQLTIFGLALSTETRNVRLAAIYDPSDQSTHDLYQKAIASRWFIPANVEGSDPFEWVQSHQADAVIIAPLEKDGPMQLLINAQNSLRAQSIETYLKAISPKSNLSQMSFDIRALYNPTFVTSHYMVPGVLSMLVCLVTILLTSMAMVREREVGTIETLLSAPIDAWDLLLGKTIPFILLGLLQVPLILAAGVILFGLPMTGPFSFLLISSFLMVVTTVCIGLYISTISQNQQQAMLGGFIFLFPAVLLSGLMFPVENMPWYIQPLAYINPLTHYIGLLRNILLMGGNTRYFLIHASALAGIALVMIVLVQLRTIKRVG